MILQYKDWYLNLTQSQYLLSHYLIPTFGGPNVSKTLKTGFYRIMNHLFNNRLTSTLSHLPLHSSSLTQAPLLHSSFTQSFSFFFFSFFHQFSSLRQHSSFLFSLRPTMQSGVILPRVALPGENKSSLSSALVKGS